MTDRLLEIDHLTEEFSSEFGDLEAPQLNWKPDAGSWSIAQVLQHLVVINRSYFPAIDALHAGTYRLPWTGHVRWIVNWMGRMILKSVQPDYARKTKTLPIWEPGESNVDAGILGTFVHQQDALKSVIRGSVDLVARDAVISSPASRLIVYRLATAFDIIIAHERRHLEQAKRVKHQLPGSLTVH